MQAGGHRFDPGQLHQIFDRSCSKLGVKATPYIAVIGTSAESLDVELWAVLSEMLNPPQVATRCKREDDV